MKKYYWFIGFISLLVLTACGGSEVEPTPGLVLPTAVIQEASTPLVTVAVATLPPSALTPVNTPTLAPTATPELGPTPTALPPTLIPSDVVIEVANRPFLSQDLLFVGEGELKKWSYRDGSVATLLFRGTSGRQDVLFGDVHRFAISADGAIAVAARTTPTDSTSSELWWVDTASGQNRQLVANVPGLIDLALSPDGRSLLYVASDVDNLFVSGTVYRLDLADGATPTAVGRCTDEPMNTADPFIKGNCMGGQWTRDSQNMLWSDAQGIWLRHLNANEPTLILPVQTEGGSDILSLYQMHDWSLNGRYLLLSISRIEQLDTAVLDLVTNELIDVPGTTVGFNTGYVEVDWMQDGRLFIIREQDEQRQYAPTLELWRLTEGQLTREETTALQLPPHNWLQDAVHFITGRFGFTLLADDPNVSGLYLMASSNEQPQRLNGLPFLTGDTTWLYDNVGTMLAMPGRDNAFVFLGVNPGEGVVYDVRPFLGEHASNFIWLPR